MTHNLKQVVEGERLGGARLRGFEVNGLLAELRGGETSQSDSRGASDVSPRWKTTTTVFASATTANKVLFIHKLWPSTASFRFPMVRQYDLSPLSFPTLSNSQLAKRFSSNLSSLSPTQNNKVNFFNQVQVDSVVSRFQNLTFHLWAATPGRLITGLGQGFFP